MEDQEIVELYWNRNELAVEETEKNTEYPKNRISINVRKIIIK